jgi:transcription factor CON7
MYLADAQPQQQHRDFVNHPASVIRASGLQQLGSRTPEALRSMERSAPEYSQSGLPSPYPSTYGDTQSEASSADHASAATYPSTGEARSANYSTSATPTSEYSVYPPSARSSSFPEHIRAYHPASNHSGSSGGMAQTPTSPSMPSHDGRNHQPQQVKSNDDIPLDPSLAQPSPTYGQSQYSPYAPPQPHHDNMQSYPQSGGLYPQARPDWTGYGQAGHMPQTHHVYPPTPTSAAPAGGRPAQVSSRPPPLKH